MFILDVYKFCESYSYFTRQHLARFIYQHKDSERFSKAAGLSHREFCSAASKEFCAKMLSAGYIDGKCGEFVSKGSLKRPFEFNFESLSGYGSKYIKEMMNIGTMTDDELFS